MTIKRQYGSMPNLTAAALTTGGDTTAILQTPTAVTIQPVSTEPIAFCPTSIELANYAGQQVRELPTAKVENGSPSVSSDRQVIGAEPNRDGSGESDAKSQDLVGRPKRLWYSLPNIALNYTDNVLYDTDIKCTAPMRVSCGSSTRSSMTVTEATVTEVQLKRCSLWKRAKKFTRRVFCCAAR